MIPSCKNKRIFGIDYTMEFTVIEASMNGTDATIPIPYTSDIKDNIICSFLIGAVGGLNNAHINTCIPLYSQSTGPIMTGVRVKNDMSQLVIVSVGVFYKKKVI